MIFKLKFFFLIFLSILGVQSCKKDIAIHDDNTFAVNQDTVFILKPESINMELKTQKVDTINYSKEIITTGTVQPIPTQYAYIAPPFAGRISKSFIKLGQKVCVGTPLFEINSPDFTATQKEYYQAKSEKEMAYKDLLRKEALLKHGVASQREYEEVENLYQIAEKEYQNTLAALKVFQANPETMSLGQALTVYAPINGEVIENNIIVGQYIAEDAEPLAIIADLSDVWVTAQVKEKDIRLIHKGDSMDIHLAAFPDSEIKGNVFHIQEAVDDETRSIKVLSVCDNKEGILKIGLFTTVHFYDNPRTYIKVPTTALLQGEKDTYVFVKDGDNKFVRKNVEVENTKSGEAIILNGLESTDIILSEGGYYLPQIH